MEGPNFHLSFIPKKGEAIKHIESLIKTEDFNLLLTKILKKNKIAPEKIILEETEKGRGKKDTVFEGFHFKKFSGKVSGERKKLFGKDPFITRFELSLLKGKERDGLLLRSMDKHGTKDAKVVTEGLYNELIGKVSEDGPINWNHVTRTGTF